MDGVRIRENATTAPDDVHRWSLENGPPHRHWRLHSSLWYGPDTTPCPKKTKQICFCQNFVKFQ